MPSSIIKRLWLLPLLGLLAAPCFAATYTATTCGRTDVAAAFTAEAATPVNGDIIVIPSGSCTWASDLTVTLPAVNLTMQGNTTISGSGGTTCATPPTYTTACTATDNTTIVDGSSDANPLFTFVLPSGTSEFRITGITWNGNCGTVSSNLCTVGQTLYHGIIGNSGSTTSAGPQLRVDHCHFTNFFQTAVRVYDPAAYGVWDHNVVDYLQSNANGIQVYGGWGANPPGSVPWNQATNFGTATFTFIENNTFNGGFPNDCTQGGRQVIRYNTLVGTGNQSIQSHATNGDGDMGCRASEVYGNHMSNSGTCCFEFQSSGTILSYNNVANSTHILDLVSDRDNARDYTESAPPAGWGYCGTGGPGGVQSNWDGNINSNGSNGWPCLEQIGRGQGDLLLGTFSTICNQTQGCPNYTGTWPREDFEPLYSWNESGQSGTLESTDSPSNNIQANRDFYIQAGSTAQTTPSSPFSGATGTGWGTLANRPTTCTAGAGGSGENSPVGSYGVGYFATDANSGQGELYICTATNTWTASYEPYTYPHPLTGGSTPPPPAPAPSMFVWNGSVTKTANYSQPITLTTPISLTATLSITGTATGSVSVTTALTCTCDLLKQTCGCIAK